MFIDKYSTHIPVLSKIFQFCEINSVFEFGPGSYSTKFFEFNAKKTISVELSSEEWFKKVKGLVSSEKVEVKFLPDMLEALGLFCKLDSRCDLVFVDGSAESRVKCIEVAYGRTDIIVTHDTETASHKGDFYNWDSIKRDYSYYWIDITRFAPWTAVISNNKKLLGYLISEFPENRLKWKI